MQPSKKMLHFYQRLINVKVLLKAVETYTHKDAYYFSFTCTQPSIKGILR